jgi:kinesin family protein C1
MLSNALLACANLLGFISKVFPGKSHGNPPPPPREEENNEKDLVFVKLENNLKMCKDEVEKVKGEIRLENEKSDAIVKKLKEMIDEREGMQEEILNWEIERRKLHNKIMNLKGNIRVFCRIRPCLNVANRGNEVVFAKGDSSVVVLNKMKSRVDRTGARKSEDFKYKFDRVFGPSASQESVFQEIELLVQSALDGFGVCIFAYGPTGSGKSFTMEGPQEQKLDRAFFQNHEDRGIIPRAVQKIFNSIGELGQLGWKYSLECSVMEIYQERVYDLLDSDCKKEKQVQEIKGIVSVKGLKSVPIASPEEFGKVLVLAKRYRRIGATNSNQYSSRSHLIFQVKIQSEARVGTLNLVDLAGSEKFEAANDPKQTAEGSFIRNSLSELKTVLISLKKKSQINPSFRNSCLTHVLKNTLCSGSKVLMMVNVAPEARSSEEAKCSLTFASTVNSVKI